MSVFPQASILRRGSLSVAEAAGTRDDGAKVGVYPFRGWNVQAAIKDWER
jgi:hypothetical protein